jgi:hypothetical protein
MGSLKEIVSTWGWALIWIVFFASSFWAYHDVSEINEQLNEATPREAQRLKRRRTGICLFLVLALISAMSAQWASDLTDKKLKDNNQEIDQLSNSLAFAESKIEPRTITEKQRADFMELLKGITNRMPIKVITGTEDSETMRYARQIRSMLDDAGFVYKSDVSMAVYGATASVIENTNTSARFSDFAVAFMCYGKNDFPVLITIDIPTNGAKPVIQDQADAGAVFAYVGWAFSKIGVRPAWLYNEDLLKPGEAGIFVPQKFH